MTILFFSLMTVISLLLNGCDASVEPSSQASREDTNNSAPLTIEVYKYDGSLQCRGGGVSIEEMAADLTEHGICVLSSYSDVDGYYHIALCGAPTGAIHVFEIEDKSLDQAANLGFHPLTDLPGLHDLESEIK